MRAKAEVQDSRNLGEEKKGTGSRNRRERQFLGCTGDERSKNWGKRRLRQGGRELCRLHAAS